MLLKMFTIMLTFKSEKRTLTVGTVEYIILSATHYNIVQLFNAWIIDYAELNNSFYISMGKHSIGENQKGYEKQEHLDDGDRIMSNFIFKNHFLQ